MKKLLSKTLSVILVLCLLLSIVPFTAFAQGATVEYYVDNNTQLYTGIKKITLDGNNYYDCSSNQCVDNVDTAYLYDMLSKKVSYSDTESFSVLERWGYLAGAIFEAEQPYTCSHDYADYYGENHSTDKPEQCFVGEILGNASVEDKIDKKNDGYYSTGLSSATSFSQIRQKMGDEVAKGIGRNNCDGSDILGQGNNADDSLEDLKDDTNRKILYNMVTSITREGKTYKYQYNSYGVAFYDFELCVIADEDLEYVSDAQQFLNEEVPIDAAIAAGVEGFEHTESTQTNYISTTTNEDVNSKNEGVEITITNSQTVSSSITNSSTITYGQAIGGEVSFEAGLKSLVKGNFGLNMNFTFNEAYSQEAMSGGSTTSSIDNSYTANCEIPAQTVMYVKEDYGETKLSMAYDLPVAVTFKVAIFSISGDVYADGAAVLAFSTGGYDQENFSTFFGENLEAGGYAYTSLANRYANRTIPGWDGSYGNNHFYRMVHNGGSDDDNTTKDLDWDEINTVFMNCLDTTTFTVADMSTRIPMLSSGAKTTIKATGIDSSIYEPKPLYLPVSLRIIDNDKQNFIIYDGGRYYMNTISIGCFNKNNVPYYPFKATDGTWEVCEGSEDIIEFDPDTFSVVAKNIGTGYLQWKLHDDIQYTAEKESGVVTSADLAPVKIAFSVRNNPFTKTAAVSVCGDEFSGTVGEAPVAVDELLTVSVDGAEDEAYAYAWELNEDCDETDVRLTDDGKIEFLNEGTYKIRAKLNFGTEQEFATEWFEITPREERAIVSAKLKKDTIEPLELLFRYFRNHKHMSQATVNIASFVEFYDQYGDVWTDEATKPEITISVNNSEGAYIDDDHIVISKGGDYSVDVISYGLQNPFIGTISLSAVEDIRYHHGDVDGDEKLTVFDASYIQCHIAQLNTIPEDRLTCADVDKNGEITILDATTIQLFIAQLIPSL